MRYIDIKYMNPINRTDPVRVAQLKESMKEKGFVGCPILIFNDTLLTGSHRLEALRQLAEEDDRVLFWDVAEDVTDIVNQAYDRRIEEEGWAPDLDYGDIGWLFEGSWVEQYKDEIEEW